MVQRTPAAVLAQAQEQAQEQALPEVVPGQVVPGQAVLGQVVPLETLVPARARKARAQPLPTLPHFCPTSRPCPSWMSQRQNCRRSFRAPPGAD